MSRFKLSRRAVLRGAGSIAIALPWLEAMGTRAYGAGTTAARFLSVYTPGGTVLSKWRPTGTTSAFTLSPILAPLEDVRAKLLVLDGLEMKSAIGEQHQGGIVAFLSGTGQSDAHNRYASGPSVDQVIATRISKGKKKFGSVQMALRWGTGTSLGRLSPINCANFEDNAAFNPIPPRLDPVAIFNDLFGTLDPNQTAEAAARLERKKSVLDFLDRKYATLSQKLGASDRAKVDQHLTKIREMEQSLAAMPKPPASCRAPTLIDTSDYNPRTGLNSAGDGSVRDISTDTAIPKVGKLMMDMMVMAMACDLTAVGSLQWSDTEAKHTFPWLGLNEHHHFYEHDGGFRPVECEKIYTWYSQQHAYLLKQMDGVDMGGHSLLDESVVLFGSELQDPPSHNKQNMPFLLAGAGGGLRGNRWLRFDNVSHNNMLVGILNLFGDARTTFGDPQYCTGALPGLT